MGSFHQSRAGSELWGAKERQSWKNMNMSPSHLALQAQRGRSDGEEGLNLGKCSFSKDKAKARKANPNSFKKNKIK